MKLSDLLARIRAWPIVSEAFARLSQGLPPTLTYHSVAHSDDVLQEALLFGLHDNLEPRELELIAVAAAYHDLGFLERSTDNETVAARLAGEAMQRFGGFSAGEQEFVRQAIIDTQVKITPEGPRQISSSKLSNYLLDADVSNLGRDDFFEKAELVRQEIGVADGPQFLSGLRTFLLAHRWYSPAGSLLRSGGKAKNLAEVERRLKIK